LKKYNLDPPKTWDDMLHAAAAISEKEKGVDGLGLTTKTGSVRTFQEFISWFFQVNGGENPFKYDDAAKKWVMNTTPEKLAQVLTLYRDIFFKSTPPQRTPTRGATTTKPPMSTTSRAKAQWFRWDHGSTAIETQAL